MDRFPQLGIPFPGQKEKEIYRGVMLLYTRTGIKATGNFESYNLVSRSNVKETSISRTAKMYSSVKRALARLNIYILAVRRVLTM